MPAQYDITPEGGYRLRLVGPAVNPGGPTTTVLGRAFGAVWLNEGHGETPASSDFAEGNWVGRLGDAGDFTITFPNAASPNGPAWRDRFDPTGALEFIEIYHERFGLEFVGNVQKVQSDRGSVVVSGQSAPSLLRRAYETDFTCVMAPRDVIERYSRVWTLAVADTFAGNSLDTTKWHDNSTAGTVSVANGLVMTPPAGGGNMLVSALKPIAAALADPWRFTTTISFASAAASGAAQIGIGPSVTAGWALVLGASITTLQDLSGGATVSAPAVSRKAPVSCTLEYDGRWVRAYVNGGFIGSILLKPGTLTVNDLTPYLTFQSAAGSTPVTWGLAAARTLSPFLLRGSDKGDYVLPGSASTYPPGGLHGRFYNDLDLAGDTYRTSKILAPSRAPYADDQLATINNPTSHKPGADDSHWSLRAFGSVYLKAGAYTFTVANLDDGARLWVSKTGWNDQIIDDWNTGGARTVTGTYTAPKDGWYPIVLEYFADATPNGCQLKFTPPSSYTDPGGTALTGGASVIIPATSLSPLGCVDQRFQGASHFDIVQKTAQDFGYQWSSEEFPQSLESGEFPGRIAPRIRVGTDYDITIEPDDVDAREGITNYQSTLDSSEQVSSIRGAGAGPPDGQGSAPVTEVLDVPSLQSLLFDLQAWTDASDIAFASLLYARLASELGLRLSPWQEVTGDPAAHDRLADTFPLSGQLKQAHWRPGDGARLQLPDVSVLDTVPRQFMQVERTFTPRGRTGAKVGFRAGPRSGLFAVRRLLAASLRPQRNFQGQRITLNGNFVGSGGVAVAAGGFSGFSETALDALDDVVRAFVRVTGNSATQPFDIEVNGTLRGANLSGPWGGPVPVHIDITPYAVPSSNTLNSLYVRLKNTGASSTNLSFQLFVVVHRNR